MIDGPAQDHVGWPDDWIKVIRQPRLRTRLDIRPRPYYFSEFLMGIRKVGERDIVGAASVTFYADETPAFGITMRPDQRRSGLGVQAALALIALLRRHFGLPVIGAYTGTTNLPANRGLVSIGAQLVGEGIEHTAQRPRRATQPVPPHRCRSRAGVQAAFGPP
jgi:RimJ/RimL family protein N-acetyltransferase